MEKKEKQVSNQGNFSFRVTVCRMTGREHQKQNMPCEDVLYIRETPGFSFYGIADGQSGTSRGAEGGMACLEAVAAYVQSYGIRNMACMRFPDEGPYMIMREIRKTLLTLSEKEKCDCREYASTIVAVAIDSVTGIYAVIHLGDGCALGVQNDDVITVLSSPEQHFSGSHTWLTTSENAVSHLRLIFGCIHGKKRLILMTDGATCLCKGKHVSEKALTLLLNEAGEEVSNYLMCSNPRDDACCIVIDCSEKARV